MDEAVSSRPRLNGTRRQAREGKDAGAVDLPDVEDDIIPKFSPGEASRREKLEDRRIRKIRTSQKGQIAKFTWAGFADAESTVRPLPRPRG